MTGSNSAANPRAANRQSPDARTVLITGASSGIGRAAATEFARRGASLVLAARRADRLEAVAAECRAIGAVCRVIPTDVTSRDACRDLVAQAGRVDVLVNNAGFGVFDPIAQADASQLERMMQTNYFGMVHCTQAVLPQMLERRGGVIVNVASIAGIMGFAGMGGYCATKFAIIGFTEALRDEVLPHGVRVTLVCPGTTESEFFETAEFGKMPKAERLTPTLQPPAVAKAICDAASSTPYRLIIPVLSRAFMKFKELFPRLAHFLMRRVSALLE